MFLDILSDRSSLYQNTEPQICVKITKAPLGEGIHKLANILSDFDFHEFRNDKGMAKS